MKKRKVKITTWIILFTMLIGLFQTFIVSETYKAASSYTNAKEFYESTALDGEEYHVETVDGTIYYATCAKLASSSSNLRYHTVGFDIQLSGNGHSVSFTVQRTGGSMEQIGQPVRSNGYEYILYAVRDKKLFELASKSNPTEAAYVLNASRIEVKMDAILTTKQGNDLKGGITENGSGGFTRWGTIYRLKDSADLNALKRIFTGHDFKSYYNIQEKMQNYSLNVFYSINGTDASNVGCSSKASIGASGFRPVTHQVNGRTYANTLYNTSTSSLHTSSSKTLNTVSILNPDDILLTKTGYHLVDGQEWVTENRRYFTHTTYMSKDIDANAGSKDVDIYLYANWQPNTYTITYDANGGTGTVVPTALTYDQTGYLRANTFSKTGFYLETGKEWNTKPDGTGESYGSNEAVTNLTSVNGEQITLYANWKAITVSIDLDKKGGTGGSDTIYEKYATGFYSDKTTQNLISSISIPTKTGYTFEGYYANFYPSGLTIIDKNGTINVPNNYFIKNTILYADYEPKVYTLTFDKQGGTGGTDTVNPVYDEVLPFAEAPVKQGSSFKGYYTKPNGQGIMYYNEFMASDTIYQTDGDLTLYAYWVDETPPEAYLTASNNEWTNRTITLNASATDYGSGLSSVQLYQDGVLVANYQNLNGAINKTFTFANNKEGVVLYLLVATDMSGNAVEVQRPVYYDIKAPVGTITYRSVNGNGVFFRANVTDINVQ